MAYKPIKPPPPPVGDEVFFQIPELEQLPRVNYKEAGNCRIVIRGDFFKFHILKHEEKFVVAHTLRQIFPDQRLVAGGGSSLPFSGNARLVVVPMQRLPTGDYRLAGAGKIKAYGEVAPSKIYILEKVIRFRDGQVFPDNRQFVAVQQLIPNIPTGSLLEVLRKGRVLTVSVDRRTVGTDESSFLNEEMMSAEKSIYAWFGTNFVPVHHFPRESGT